MSPHVDPARALALMALPRADPEHVAARRHAAECSECQQLLEESCAMLRLLDRSLAAPDVAPALRARVLEHVRARPPRRPLAAHLPWLAVALLSLVLSLIDGQLERPLSARLGLDCALFESGFALLPLAVGGLLARRGLVHFEGAQFASMTASFAVIGQLLLRTRCEAHDAFLHLFVFHFLTVLAIALLVRFVPRALQGSARSA